MERGFSRAGIPVKLYDLAPDRAGATRLAAESVLRDLWPDRAATAASISVVASLASAVRDVDYVREYIVEEVQAKRDLRRVGSAQGSAGSAVFLGISAVARRFSGRERMPTFDRGAPVQPVLSAVGGGTRAKPMDEYAEDRSSEPRPAFRWAITGGDA